MFLCADFDAVDVGADTFETCPCGDMVHWLLLAPSGQYARTHQSFSLSAGLTFPCGGDLVAGLDSSARARIRSVASPRHARNDPRRSLGDKVSAASSRLRNLNDRVAQAEISHRHSHPAGRRIIPAAGTPQTPAQIVAIQTTTGTSADGVNQSALRFPQP